MSGCLNPRNKTGLLPLLNGWNFATVWRCVSRPWWPRAPGVPSKCLSAWRRCWAGEAPPSSLRPRWLEKCCCFGKNGSILKLFGDFWCSGIMAGKCWNSEMFCWCLGDCCWFEVISTRILISGWFVGWFCWFLLCWLSCGKCVYFSADSGGWEVLWFAKTFWLLILLDWPI